MSTAPLGFGFADRDYVYRRVNETLAAINGAAVHDHIGRTVEQIVPELWPYIERSTAV